MAYATDVEFVDRYSESETVQLTDRDDPKTGLINYQVLDKALSDASAVMDSIIVAAGAMPPAVPLPVFSYICTEIARCLLYDDHAPDTVKARCEEAKTLLKQLADSGRLEYQDSESEVGDLIVNAPNRVFRRSFRNEN